MIKKFRAPTMREAMEKAKGYFGEETVVLDTKKISNGGLFDIKGSNIIEITATSTKYQQPAQKKTPTGKGKSFYTPADFQPKRPKRTDKINADIMAELNALKASLNDMKEYLKTKNMMVLPEAHRYLTEEQGIDDELATDLVQSTFIQLDGPDLKDQNKIKQVLRTEITESLKTKENLDVSSNKQKVICMVGPTGMGKTTSIIKLATHPEFYGKKRVALITIDTYRVAAAAQLKTFAALAKLPLDIVYQPGEYAASLERFKNHEIVLVDTAGRSPLNSNHLDDLKRFFNLHPPDEIHLVLSVTTGARSLLDAVKNFAPLSINRLVVSKIDETFRFGNILNVGKRTNIPFSFITNGQKVPDDIHFADKNEIANLIVS